MVHARVAMAGRIHRTFVFRMPGVLDIETAETREQLSVAGVTGRHDAVELVDAARDALDEVLRRTCPHQISWGRNRQPCGCLQDNLIHLVYRLADAQAADR